MTWAVQDMGSLGDEVFMRWGVQEMGPFELDLRASYQSVIAVYRFGDDSQWPLSAMNLFVAYDDEITLFQILLYVVPL